MSFASMKTLVTCPICSEQIPEEIINVHLDNNCSDVGPPAGSTAVSKRDNPLHGPSQTKKNGQVAPIFATGKGKTAQSKPTPSSSIQVKSGSSHKRPSEEGTQFHTSTPSKRSKASTSSHKISENAPLAERLRPQSLDDFVGQTHLTGPDSLLMGLIRNGSTGSTIFWGPPGCGKTTLARLMAKETNAVFKELSATDSGIADVRAVAEEAKNVLALTRRRTILFLDEVHRFNKAQQDIFLPFIEQGVIQLIGATTENPSFKLTGALISRCRVFVLERLTDEDIAQIVTQAVRRVSPEADTVEPSHAPRTGEVSSPTVPPPSLSPSSKSQDEPCSQTSSTPTVAEPHFPAYPHLTPKIFHSLVSLSAGDARTALSLLELVLSAPSTSDPEKLLASLRRSVSTSYDRTGDARYDMISALHKSVRGSQGSAALYWLARMLSAGEDPLYIARRMVVCASEDIGLADSHALPLAMAAYQACQVIGMPECRINLAHIVSYLAEAPKSTRAYNGYNRAEAAAKQDMTLPVPLMVRNAPTSLMKNLGYSHGYAYNPDYAHPVTNDYIPEQFRGEIFLKPEGDISDKTWDEAALQKWEVDENGGERWVGRERVSKLIQETELEKCKMLVDDR